MPAGHLPCHVGKRPSMKRLGSSQSRGKNGCSIVQGRVGDIAPRVNPLIFLFIDGQALTLELHVTEEMPRSFLFQNALCGLRFCLWPRAICVPRVSIHSPFRPSIRFLPFCPQLEFFLPVLSLIRPPPVYTSSHLPARRLATNLFSSVLLKNVSLLALSIPALT